MSSRRAALRQQQLAEEQAKRTKRIAIAAIAIVTVAVVAVLALLGVRALSPDAPTGGQGRPPAATAGHGILVAGKPPVDGVPHLVMWGDYQCPYCAVAEHAYGEAIIDLVEDGRLTAEVRTAHFRDGKSEFGPSRRAAMAAAAADAVGHFDAYHVALYEAMGNGFPDAFLREELPARLGITGSDLGAFQRAYDDRTFAQFTADANEALYASGVEGTPSYQVDGVDLELFGPGGQPSFATPEALLEAVTAAAR